MTAASRAAAIVSLGVVALVAGHCRRAPVLTQLAEARRLAADSRVQVDRAADASNRAIMADTDEASHVFSRAAGRSRDAVTADADALAPILQDLGFAEEARALQEFRHRFAQYVALDAELVRVSRRNSDVQSLAVSLGQQRILNAACDESLHTLLDALATRGFAGTR